MSVTKAPWGERQHTATTWYEPFSEMERIQQAVNFVLSHDVTGLCTPGDVRILPLVLKACENFTALSGEEQGRLIEIGRTYQPLFA